MSEPSNTDAHIENTLESSDDAAEALLALWKEEDAEKPSEDESEDNENEADADDAEDSDEDADEPSEDEDDEDSDDESEEDDDEDSEDKEDKKKPKTLKDSDIVKVTVDGKELDVPVTELKRLYGQEAALTRKSQEVATLRKQVEDVGLRHVTGTEVLLKRAQERYAPYANIDWLVAAQKLDAEELTALRTEATKAYEDIQFLSTEIDQVMKQTYETRNRELVETARKTLKELQDPKTGIPGFNEDLYNEIRVYAINQGLPEDVVNSMVLAPMFRMAYKAMVLDKSKKATTKVTVDKKNKKVIKSKVSAETSRKAITKSPDKAMKRFQKTGSTDDAAEALLSMWQNDN